MSNTGFGPGEVETSSFNGKVYVHQAFETSRRQKKRNGEQARTSVRVARDIGVTCRGNRK
jgi:hypothetical protein